MVEKLQKKIKPSCDACKAQADNKHREIEKRAYEIFLQKGSRAGRTAQDWCEAEQELLAEQPEASIEMPCGCGCTTQVNESQMQAI